VYEDRITREREKKSALEHDEGLFIFWVLGAYARMINKMVGENGRKK